MSVVAPRRVFTGKAWEASAPHAPAVVLPGPVIVTSGLTARGPEGHLVGPNDMARQCEQLVTNIGDVLKSAGAEIKDIVKLTMYTTDIDAFLAARHAWAVLYAGRPCSTLVEVARLQLPGMVIECEVMAAA